MMSEWQDKRLGEVVDLLTGYPFKSGYYIEDDSGIKLLRGDNIVQGLLRWENVKRWPVDSNEFYNKYKLASDDVVLAMDRPWIEAGLKYASIRSSDLPCLLVQRVARLRGSSELDCKFLKYLIGSREFTEHVRSVETGTAVPHISASQIREFPFHLPPFSEQRAIADLLGSLDNKIDLLHRQNKTLEALAETLFRQWFVEEADDDWETTTFAEHVDAFRGLSYKGSGLTELELGLPMHNLNSVFEGGGYKEAGIKYYSGDYQQRHIVHSGDVIVTNTEQGHEFRLIGFPAIVPRHFGDTGIFSQHIYRVVPKKASYLTRDFLYYLIMERDVREQIISATNGSTVNMLAIDGLQRPTFRLPPHSRVQEFTRFATESRQKRELNHDAVCTLEKLRDSLLPKLMSGEVRVI